MNNSTSAFNTLTLTLCLFFAVTLTAQSSFINEVNYLSNNPTEAGIEIAGEAGQDLSGWSLVIYLADGAVSSTEYLAGYVIPNQQNGYGTIWYDVDQSSGGGGVALVNPNNEVIQFLSYGAPTTLIASAGPAVGLTADHIGIQILPSKALGLVGTGLEAADFLWSLGSTSPGSVNLDQIFGMLANLQSGFSNDTETNTPDLNIRTYPNPIVDELNIRLSQELQAKGSIILFDAAGAVLRQLTVDLGQTNFRLNVQDLPSGMYFIHLQAGEFAQRQMIIK